MFTGHRTTIFDIFINIYIEQNMYQLCHVHYDLSADGVGNGGGGVVMYMMDRYEELEGPRQSGCAIELSTGPA